MEQRNREEIIQIKGDISHIKITTEDIKTGVAALVARAEQNGKEIVDLRGRVREAEHDIIAIKSDIKTLKTGFAKLAVCVALAAGGATITIDKFIGLFK